MDFAHPKHPHDMAVVLMADGGSPIRHCLHALGVLHRLRHGLAPPGSIPSLVDMYYRTRRRQAQTLAALFARGGAP